MTRYFVDETGRYIGGFEGSGAMSGVPAGAFEVPEPPKHARLEVWDGEGWFISQAEMESSLAKDMLKSGDLDAVRLIEDVWDVLKGKGLVSDDDLPEAARAKMEARRAHRSKV